MSAQGYDVCIRGVWLLVGCGGFGFFFSQFSFWKDGKIPLKLKKKAPNLFNSDRIRALQLRLGANPTTPPLMGAPL